MSKNQDKERVCINIDKESKNWIKEKIEANEFDNQSSGVRKCIQIAKRVYEKATPEEKTKFIIAD